MHAYRMRRVRIVATDFHVSFHSGMKRTTRIDGCGALRLQVAVDREPRWLLLAWWWAAWQHPPVLLSVVGCWQLAIEKEGKRSVRHLRTQRQKNLKPKMMFSALVRNALPPLRSLSTQTISFAGVGSHNLSSISLSCWFNKVRSPLFLMSGIREKSCLQTNKSAAKRFIVRGNGRIKR